MPMLRPIRHRFATWASAAVVVLLTVAAAWLLAHEGHASLPTRGAQIDRAKGQVILSAEARAALDVRTAEVRARPVPASVLAYATLVSPWQKRGFVTPRLTGRVVKLHARPGQAVAAG